MEITLVSSQPVDFFINEVSKYFTLQVSLHQWQLGGFNFLRLILNGRPSPKVRKNFQEQVAEIVAAFIVHCWEKALLTGMLSNLYEDLEDKEIEEICERARSILERGEASFFQSRQWRGEPIAVELKNYFQEHSYLNIDGFIRFRLPDYYLELERALEEALDEFLLEKEYDEFIRLLRYFVDAQEIRVDKVHVVLMPGGGFQLYDGEDRNLNGDYLQGFVVDMGETEINYEDLLISALITIAPRQIVLHAADKGRHRNAINTIKSVFGDRVLACTGCKRCRQIQRKL
ncbi:MAG: hypothetical protein PWP65_1680 [Clostridia bacterium]|nr:hypothetical protein [Clostridia bacterium]